MIESKLPKNIRVLAKKGTTYRRTEVTPTNLPRRRLSLFTLESDFDFSNGSKVTKSFSFWVVCCVVLFADLDNMEYE